MESYCELNVSYNGEHFFATAPRSIRTDSQAKKMLKIFREKFTEEDGYKVTATHYECSGRILKW